MCKLSDKSDKFYVEL